MSFWQKALDKSAAIMKAALALVLFICVDYAVYAVFAYLKIDRNIYKGIFNLITCVLVFAVMFVIHKVESIKKEPLIRVGKLGANQVAATVILGLGMLGFVVTYLSVADMISQYIQSLNQAIVEYRESVNRFSDTPQIVVPLWDTLLYIFTLSFIVPVTEEMTFRGVVYGELRRSFGPAASVILSAAGFGIMHGLSVHIGYALVCGLIIASCYYLTDSIVAPVILHMIFNILGSGLPSFLAVEYFGIPVKFSSTLMTVINMAVTLLMPAAVLAMAYLVSAKRKKAKEALASAGIVIESEAVQTDETPVEKLQETDSGDSIETLPETDKSGEAAL